MSVTENWSAEKYSPGASATRQWIVTDVGNADAAISAIADAQENASHYLDASLFADAPSVSRVGPVTYQVDATYSPRTQEGLDTNMAVRPYEFELDFEPVEEPVEIDGDERPIINSAGDAFENLPTRVYYNTILRIYRYESRFLVAKALAHVGRVNRSTVNIASVGPMGGGTVGPGEMLLRVYRPTETMTPKKKYVRVAYEFAMRQGGWQWRVIDMGYRGWYSADGTVSPGKITENGKQVNFPVRLDGSGKPMNATFKVEGQTAVAAPDAISVPVERQALATFLKYTRYESVEFSGLQLF